MRNNRPFSMAATSALVLVAACAPGTTVNSPSPDASISYVVRLGADTIAAERYSRAGNRIESSLVERLPSPVIDNSNIELGPDGLPMSWRYERRLPDGRRPGNGATVILTFGADSLTVQVTRDTGSTQTRRFAGRAAIPNLGNSMLTRNLALAYARQLGRDSVDVPVIGPGIGPNGPGRGVIPIRFVTRDSARVWYFGAPMYAKLDADGQLRWLDGSQTANKLMAVRVPRVDVVTIASAAPATGPASTRDTARAQISGNAMWIDYGRPSLRGRNVWTNGVLGDTIWRTGANAATQLRTSLPIRINGQTVPAGTYTLFTHVLPGNSRYELIINRQVGQWGTAYNPAMDLMRVPLTAVEVASSAERFTMMIEPRADGGVIAMQWGRLRLETPFTVIR